METHGTFFQVYTMERCINSTEEEPSGGYNTFRHTGHTPRLQRHNSHSRTLKPQWQGGKIRGTLVVQDRGFTIGSFGLIICIHKKVDNRCQYQHMK